MPSENVKRRRVAKARRERLVLRRGYLHSLLDWTPPLAITGGWTVEPETRRLLQRWVTRPP
ncbi:MAG: hypothetical protein Q8N51_16250 [Gammaproteobacteria bacterium]|nr:hypothetical protein [Gammaproteobacteria bacterium]